MEFFIHSTSDFVQGVKLHKLPLVYALSTPNLEFIKIGKSRSFKQRFSNIQSSCPFELHLWRGIRSPKADEIELVLHDLFCEFNVRGEWYRFTEYSLDKLCSFFTLTNNNVRETANALL